LFICLFSSYQFLKRNELKRNKFNNLKEQKKDEERRELKQQQKENIHAMFLLPKHPAVTILTLVFNYVLFKVRAQTKVTIEKTKLALNLQLGLVVLRSIKLRNS
jgi:uncharacterized ion transporter superfamily protein YfcC